MRIQLVTGVMVAAVHAEGIGVVVEANRRLLVKQVPPEAIGYLVCTGSVDMFHVRVAAQQQHCSSVCQLATPIKA
jgi:hypothetical protein